MILRHWMILFVLAVGATCAAAGDALRLAILADPGLGGLQDLMTASCSTNPAVVLVERDALPVVLDELRRRDLMGTQAAVSPGSMRADAVLIVSSNSVRDSSWLRFRWVAVGTGVVIEDDLLPYPLPPLELVAAAQARQLSRLVPKFRLTRADAIRISFGGVRAQIASPKSRTLEEALSFLLTQQLMHAPRVLLLERERMRTLGEEKLLPNMVNDEFWAGSYTMQGSFRPDGTNASRWVVAASLGSPGEPVPRTWEERAEEDHLAEAVGGLVTKIMSGLGETAAKEWSRPDEAQRYLDLATLQFQAGAFQAARQSADAAWALGAPSEAARGMRMRIYAACAYPSMSVWKWYDPTLLQPLRLGAHLDTAVMAANLALNEIRGASGALSPDLSFNILSALVAGAKVLRFLDDSATVLGRPGDVTELRNSLHEVSLGLRARGQLGNDLYILDDLQKDFGGLWGETVAPQPGRGQAAAPAGVAAPPPGALTNEASKAGAYLIVTNFWTPQRVPSLKDQREGLLTGIQWQEGRIWLVFEDGVVAGSARTVFSIDPNSQQCVFWPVPARPPSTNQTTSYGLLHNPLRVTTNHLYLLCDTWVLEGDRVTGTWRYLPAPEIVYERLAVADGKVYAGFSGTYLEMSGVPNAELLRQAGIVEIDPQAASWRLIASSRRSPPEGPFDGCAPYAVNALWPWPGSGIGALVFRPPRGCEIRRFADGAWGDALLPKTSIDAVPGATGTLVWFSEGQKRVWLWQSRRADPAAPFERIDRAGMEDVSTVCLPSGMGSDGHDVVALEFESDDRASRRLRWWKEGREEPVVIPLRLEGSKHQHPPEELAVDPEGVVIASNDGFWFISRQELERFAAGSTGRP